MLEQIRHAGQSKIFKFFMALIVVSFAIWGGGDAFRSSSGYVAKIDNELITFQEVSQRLGELRNSYKQRGVEVSDEEIKRLGLDEIVVKEMILKKLLVKDAEQLNLFVDEEVVVDRVQQSRMFKNRSNNFDKAILTSFLQQRGMNYNQFLAVYQNDIAVEYLTASIFSDAPSVGVLAKQLYPYYAEKRIVDVLTISDKFLAEGIKISEDEVKKYYHEHQKDFLTPEHRNISYIDMDIDYIKKGLIFTDSEVKKEYEENVHEYNVPELRDFYNLVFISKAEAEENRKLLEGSADFASKAAEIIATDASDLLETGLDKKSLPESLRESIFNLKPNDISEPLESEHGWHLIKVVKISPAVNKSFAMVKADVLDSLKRRKADQLLYQQAQKIEDDLASGLTIEEVAEKYHLKVKHVDQLVLENSKTPHENFAEEAFKFAEKEESSLTYTPNQEAFFVLRVNKIAKPVVKDYNHVKETIISLLEAEQKQQKLQKMKKEINKSYKEKHDSKIVADQFSLPVKQSLSVERPSSKEVLQSNLPNSLVLNIFTTKLGEMSEVHKAQDEYLLAVVTDVIQPKEIDMKLVNELEATLKDDQKQSIEQQYVEYLYNTHSVKINPEYRRSL